MKTNFSARNVAIASFVIITITSWIGLTLSPKTKSEKLTPYEWTLVVVGLVSWGSGLYLFERNFENSPTEDAPPDQSLADLSKEVERLNQRVGVIDEAIFSQARVNTGTLPFADQERQARWNLMAMISDLGVEGSPLTPICAAIEICSDDRLWENPAKYGTFYSDTERFYNEEKIWPIIRDGRIEWGMRPDYDEPDESLLGYEDEDDEPSVEQTLFRSFNCCIRCKYVVEHPCGCAVVPLGCMGDASEQCREFVSQDSDVHVHMPVPEQRIEEPIFDQLARIVTAFGKPMEDAEGNTEYDDGKYIFVKGEHEINVARCAEGDNVHHIYRNLSLFDHQDIRGVGHNYFFDRTTAEDRAYFSQLAESLEDRAQGAVSPELNPVI